MEINSVQKKRWVLLLGGNDILLLIACFFVFLFPSSISGNIVSNMYIVKNGLGAIIALFIASNNAFQKKTVLWSFVLCVWLSLLTLTTSIIYQPNDFRVAFASISGFIPTIIIWCVTFNKHSVSYDHANKILLILSIGLIIWGWGLVLHNSLIYYFTRTFYSQLKENMFDNMVTIRGKPVMSFGTHSMAAFFILIVYFYHCIIIKEKKETFVNYICMTLLFLLEVPLRSTTSMVAILVMLFLLIWARNNLYTRMLTVAVVLLGALYFYRVGFVLDYAGNILYGINANHHGFDARYLSGIYSGNIYMATNYIGVGFLRSASNLFRMNDSGFVYLFTQGNIPAVLMGYGLMFAFFKRNMNKYVKLSFAMFFIWEFISASTFISVKMIFAHIMTMYIINSIVGESKMDGDESHGLR
jgi:hypothetical protein